MGTVHPITYKKERQILKKTLGCDTDNALGYVYKKNCRVYDTLRWRYRFFSDFFSGFEA